MTKEQQSFSLRRFEALGLLPDANTIYGYRRTGPGHYSKCSLSLQGVLDNFPDEGAFALRKLSGVWVISLVYRRKDKTFTAYLKPDSKKLKSFIRRNAAA